MYLDVRVDDAWTWSAPEGRAGFVYGVSGTGTVDGEAFGAGDALPMAEARPVELRSEEALRVVAVAGRPHGDPIRQRGPFVL